MRRAVVLGAAGFIGMALCARLKAEGTWVQAVDVRMSPYGDTPCDQFVYFDLRHGPMLPRCYLLQHPHGRFDEVYQLAADVGGAGDSSVGANDASVMADHVRINANVAEAFATRVPCGRLFFASSACVYNDAMADHVSIALNESVACAPSSGYGWEKLFCERLYQAQTFETRIARFATIYGPGCAIGGGRDNAVAAICRKAIDAPEGGEIEVWGDGKQLRPLVYIDDLVEGIIALTRSDFAGPVNLATADLTSCNDIARYAIMRSGKNLRIKNVPGPVGKQVLRMTTDLAEKQFGWKAATPFFQGFERTFDWIAARRARKAA